jgi:hypothetical protein
MANSSERLYKCTIDLEGTYGTGDGSPTPIPLTNDSMPELEYETISFPDYSSSLGSNQTYVGAKRWTMPVKFYLKGTSGANLAASTPCEISKMLEIFGLLAAESATTQTWTVADTGHKSATIVTNLNGVDYTMTGTRGESLRIPFVPGKPVICEGKVRGLYTVPAAASYSAPSFQDVLIIPPNVASCALTINSQTHVIPKFDVVITNSNEVIDDINAANDGVSSIDITGRNYTVEATVLRDTNNDIEWWTALVGSTQLAVASTGFGTSGGNKFDVDFTNLQLTSVKPSYYKGLQAYDIVGSINKHAVAASEFVLKLS